jgi:hypothetical protein
MQSDLLKERGVDDSSPYSPDEKNVCNSFPEFSY